MTRICSLLFLAALCPLAQPGVSDAGPASDDQRVVQVLPLEHGKGSFRIAIHREVVIHIDMQDDIRTITPTREHASVWIEKQFNRVRVRFDPELSGDAVRDIPDIGVDITTSSENVQIVFYDVETSGEASPRFFATQAREEVEAERVRQARANDEKRKSDKLSGALARIDPIPRVVIPATGKARSSDGPVHAQLIHGRWEGPELFLYYDASNASAQARPLRHPRVRDRHGESLEIDISGVESHGAEAAELVAVIPPGERVRGVVSVPRAADHETDGITLVFPGGENVAPIELTVDEWVTPWKLGTVASSEQPLALLPTTRPQQIMVPLSPEEIERERRDRDARGRLSINAQAVLGVAWLGTEQGAGPFEATSLSGIGGRVTYGLNRLFWFEATMIAAFTGESRFDRATFDGMEGELVRSATLGRAKFGGVLRLGKHIVPSVRAGLAVQVGSYDSRFFVAGSEVEGPGSTFESNGMWYAGAGMDFHFGSHFIAGAEVSAMYSADERFIEAGAHFGVTWNSRKDQ